MRKLTANGAGGFRIPGANRSDAWFEDFFAENLVILEEEQS